MAQGRKTTQELIAEEQKRAEQVRARMSELKTRQRVEDRKRDSHRKIVVGAAAMAHIRIDPQFRKALRDALNTAVTEPKRFKRRCETPQRRRRLRPRTRKSPGGPGTRSKRRLLQRNLCNRRVRRSQAEPGRIFRNSARRSALLRFSSFFGRESSKLF